MPRVWEPTPVKSGPGSLFVDARKGRGRRQRGNRKRTDRKAPPTVVLSSNRPPKRPKVPKINEIAFPNASVPEDAMNVPGNDVNDTTKQRKNIFHCLALDTRLPCLSNTDDTDNTTYLDPNLDAVQSSLQKSHTAWIQRQQPDLVLVSTLPVEETQEAALPSTSNKGGTSRLALQLYTAEDYNVRHNEDESGKNSSPAGLIQKEAPSQQDCDIRKNSESEAGRGTEPECRGDLAVPIMIPVPPPQQTESNGDDSNHTIVAAHNQSSIPKALRPKSTWKLWEHMIHAVCQYVRSQCSPTLSTTTAEEQTPGKPKADLNSAPTKNNGTSSIENVSLSPSPVQVYITLITSDVAVFTAQQHPWSTAREDVNSTIVQAAKTLSPPQMQQQHVQGLKRLCQNVLASLETPTSTSPSFPPLVVHLELWLIQTGMGAVLTPRSDHALTSPTQTSCIQDSPLPKNEQDCDPTSRNGDEVEGSQREDRTSSCGANASNAITTGPLKHSIECETEPVAAIQDDSPFHVVDQDSHNDQIVTMTQVDGAEMTSPGPSRSAFNSGVTQCWQHLQHEWDTVFCPKTTTSNTSSTESPNHTHLSNKEQNESQTKNELSLLNTEQYQRFFLRFSLLDHCPPRLPYDKVLPLLLEQRRQQQHEDNICPFTPPPEQRLSTTSALACVSPSFRTSRKTSPSSNLTMASSMELILPETGDGVQIQLSLQLRPRLRLSPSAFVQEMKSGGTPEKMNSPESLTLVRPPTQVNLIQAAPVDSIDAGLLWGQSWIVTSNLHNRADTDYQVNEAEHEEQLSLGRALWHVLQNQQQVLVLEAATSFQSTRRESTDVGKSYLAPQIYLLFPREEEDTQQTPISGLLVPYATRDQVVPEPAAASISTSELDEDLVEYVEESLQLVPRLPINPFLLS